MGRARMLKWAAFSLCGLLVSPVFAGAEDDAKAYYAQKTEQALKDLEFGTYDQKVLATYYMGALGKPMFVRPLGRALLSQLDDPAMRKASINDPYVKAHMAWALGEIEHKAAVPYLIKASEKVSAIIEEERKAVEAARQKRPATSHEFILEANEPGPFLAANEVPFGFSPDVYWSVADEFKHIPAPNPDSEDHRARLQGFNYVNVMQHILIALGKIASPDATETVAKFLSHPYPAIRMEAALTLGKIGSLSALEALEKSFDQEKDPSVRARIAFSVFYNDHTRVKYYQEILTMLKDDNVRVRLEAARALRELALGESISPLYQAYRLEESNAVRQVINQAIHNAEIDNLFPPNPLIQTGPTRIWIHGRPQRPTE